MMYQKDNTNFNGQPCDFFWISGFEEMTQKRLAEKYELDLSVPNMLVITYEDEEKTIVGKISVFKDCYPVSMNEKKEEPIKTLKWTEEDAKRMIDIPFVCDVPPALKDLEEVSSPLRKMLDEWKRGILEEEIHKTDREIRGETEPIRFDLY